MCIFKGVNYWIQFSQYFNSWHSCQLLVPWRFLSICKHISISFLWHESWIYPSEFNLEISIGSNSWQAVSSTKPSMCQLLVLLEFSIMPPTKGQMMVYGEDKLEKALEDVGLGMAIAAAARKHGIPRSSEVYKTNKNFF